MVPRLGHRLHVLSGGLAVPDRRGGGAPFCFWGRGRSHTLLAIMSTMGMVLLQSIHGQAQQASTVLTSNILMGSHFNGIRQDSNLWSLQTHLQGGHVKTSTLSLLQLCVVPLGGIQLSNNCEACCGARSNNCPGTGDNQPGWGAGFVRTDED